MLLLWPFMLLLLLLVPVLVAAYIWAQRRRHRYALRYASLSLVKEVVGRGPGIRRHIPPTLFLMSLTVMMLALARPVAVVRVPGAEGVVILAIDVSGSMSANDMDPNRMEAAKSAARAFVQQQPDGVRIGVVSFSDNAFVVQAPTADQEAVIAAINRLNTQRGTAIGRGLLTSLNAIFETSGTDAPFAWQTPTPTPTPLPKGTYTPAVIVLLSDGQSNQGPDPVEVAQAVAARGVRVYTVGLGTPQGTVLRIQGRAIHVRLDEATLRRVADMTDGHYYSASNEGDLRAIYENLGRRLSLKTEKTELTAVVIGLAFLLALAAGTLSLIWFNRLP